MFLVESEKKANRTELIVFSRDENGEKRVERVTDFKPYFYVRDEEEIPDDRRITLVNTGFKSLIGEPLKKIFVRRSHDVSEVRNLFKQHFEADILFTNRYIIDVLGEAKPYPLRILSIDIETDSAENFPNLEEPDQSITVISMTDSFTNKTISLFYQSPEATIKVIGTEEIKVFEEEEDMLNAFIVWVNRLDPDVITGWYVDGFDLPYIIRRMKILGLYPATLSPLGFVKIDDKFDRNLRVIIKGRIVLDAMKSYIHYRKTTNQGHAESYSLEFTAQDVLKKGKLQHEEFFHDMWVNDPYKLIEYNRRDALLVYELEQKIKMIEFFNVIRCKACAQLSDIFFTTTLVDGLLLRKMHNKLVLPSKIHVENREKYSGAFVFEPTPGLYKHIIALDVKGMYPNIIKTFNMGYETFNIEGNIKVDEGIAFDSGVGLMSSTVRDLEKERNHYKKMMKEAKTDEEKEFFHFRQYAVKVLANSIYGYLGAPNSRLYKKEVANAITTMGRKIIKWTQNLLKNSGYNVVYGDTDSVYIQGKGDGLFSLMAEGQSLYKKINVSYDKFVAPFGADDNSLEIEFEKIFKSILFVGKKGEEDKGAKKRYAYITLWEDGKTCTDKVQYTGFDAKRSDSARISRDLQETVLQKILNGESKENVVEYLKKIDADIRSRKIGDEFIGFPKGITMKLSDYGGMKKNDDGKLYKTGTPPVIQGCRYSNKYLGTRFSQGSKPKWVYVKGVPPGYPITNVISFVEEIPKGFTLDFNIMIDRIINKKVESLFKSVGWGDVPILDASVKSLDEWGV